MGNANSGRRPRREEERKLISKHFGAAVSAVIELLEAKDTPQHVRLDAARLLIEQHLGKPKQATELSGGLTTTGTFIFQLPDGTLKTAAEMGKAQRKRHDEQGQA